MNFAAIEILRGEVEKEAIEAFFLRADSLGLKFKSLEPFGTLTIGSSKFLRFRTDCLQLDTLIPLFQEENRSFVLPGGTGYRLVTQTTEGRVSITQLQTTKLPGYNRKWRGTADKFWERQFTK